MSILTCTLACQNTIIAKSKLLFRRLGPAVLVAAGLVTSVVQSSQEPRHRREDFLTVNHYWGLGLK